MEKYTRSDLKLNAEEINKKIISDDAYAICEFLELLCERLKNAI